MDINKIKKSFGNFWYYYKTYTKIGLAVGVLLLLWGMQSHTDIFMSSRMKNHDIVIMIASLNDIMTPTYINQFTTAVENYITEDFNRDKNITVGANAIYKSQNAAENFQFMKEMLNTMGGALNTEMRKDESFILILDKDAFDFLADIGRLTDLSILCPEFVKQSGTYGILYNTLAIGGAFAEEEFEYYIAFREYSETLAKKKRYAIRYEQSEKVIRNILEGSF